MKREIRIIAKELRVKKSDDGRRTISGYAAVFDSLSENLGGFVEKIAPGAFAAALKKSDARALFNHDSNIVLGRQSAGTLRLKEDDIGLMMEVDLPDTSAGRDLEVLIERGDINQQSFGFTVASDLWEDMDEEVATRTLLEIEEIFDVSPVVFPAYEDTTVAIRSLEDCRSSKSRSSAADRPKPVNHIRNEIQLKEELL